MINNCINNCIFKYIGTDSMKSDVDVNIISKISGQVIHDIIDEHYKNYKNNLDDMFQTNIYGTVFRNTLDSCMIDNSNLKHSCTPRYAASYKQRLWSTMRIVMNAHYFDYLRSEFPNYCLRIYHEIRLYE